MRNKPWTVLAPFAFVACAHAQSTAFTYQGELKEGGSLATGAYDMRFTLFDSATGGVQVGSAQCVDNVPVAGGKFTTTIDFGQQFSTVASRFMQIQVRLHGGLTCTNSSGFIAIEPRQPITAVPLANHSKSAFTLAASDGSPSNAVFVDGTGKVGIGTTSPTSTLHAFGSRAGLRLQDDSSLSSSFYFEDSQITQSRILKFTSSGPSLIDVNPMPLDRLGNANVRFFRETNTTGTRSVIFYSGNNSTATSAAIGVGGTDSYFQLDGGNVGIGTALPAAKLDVRGDIRLGSNGQFRAVAGEESLRIIRGVVNTQPASFCTAEPSVLVGSGFSVVRTTDCGRYRLTFDTPFGGLPAVTATGILSTGCAAIITVSNLSPSEVSVQVTCPGLGEGNAAWSFSFIAIGPR